jgi:hypothetical protein
MIARFYKRDLCKEANAEHPFPEKSEGSGEDKGSLLIFQTMRDLRGDVFDLAKKRWSHILRRGA